MRWPLIFAALLVTSCSREVDLQSAALSRDNGVIRVLIGGSGEHTKFAYLRLLLCGAEEKKAYSVVLGDVRLGKVTDVELVPEDLLRLPPAGRLCAQVSDETTPLIRYTSNVVRVVER